MIYETLEEYTTAITQTRQAIARIIQIGQSHENSSGATSRKTTEIELSALREHLALLQDEKAQMYGASSILSRRSAGW